MGKPATMPVRPTSSSSPASASDTPKPMRDSRSLYQVCARADGTAASVDQMAKDVTTFLAWSAEPEMETRKRTGVKVILFLLVLTGLLYAVKRKVWAAVH